MCVSSDTAFSHTPACSAPIDLHWRCALNSDTGALAVVAYRWTLTDLSDLPHRRRVEATSLHWNAVTAY
jgi:hypothetical protein